MNELLLDLETAAPWLRRSPRHVPGAISSIWCRPTRAGGLMFAWQRPPGEVEGFQLERTRDGHAYELLDETKSKGISLPRVAVNDGWFYRVTAFNSRGQGPARWVFFFLRRRNPIFLRMAVRPGLRVVINELIPM